MTRTVGPVCHQICQQICQSVSILGLLCIAIGPVTSVHAASNVVRHPNLDGVWLIRLGEDAVGKPDPGPPTLKPTDGQPLPLQPWAAAIRDAFDSKKNGSEDWPGNNQRCLVAGTLRAMRANYPWRLIETEEQVTILFEEDGRVNIFPFLKEHRKDAKPTWTGDSIARWEGDTLVIDSVGFNGKTPLPYAVQITTRMHMTHRLKLAADGKQLEMRTTVDDAGTFTRPFEVISKFDRWDDYEFAEYRCAENNQDYPAEISWWKANWGPM